MKNALMTVAEAAQKIGTGAALVIAGSEQALAQLPKGRWIGGTSVYFLTEHGGVCDQDNVFVTEFLQVQNSRICYYGTDTLPSLTQGKYDHGLSAILIPAFSKAHSQFAIEGMGYAGVFEQPLFGWITGTHLDDIGKVTPKIFDGATGSTYDEGAVLLHVELPATKTADLDIVNIFSQDTTADTITFDADGFTVTNAIVNGENVNFAKYVIDKGLDTQLPLVADYAGAMINVSFQAVDAEAGKVHFYAPVMRGIDYRLAKSKGAYAEEFGKAIQADGSNALSCNCILNYLYGEMAGKKTGSYTGPATFGEIAYILLNQTMVHVSLKVAEASRVA